MSYEMKNITVLLVDSQPAIVELISGVLHLMGVRRIITRTDGKSGLLAFRKTAPDLIIIDWDLANLDGLAFTRQIRAGEVNPFVPIIFMTAFSSEKRVRQARDSGITEFLRKPFTAESLYKRIEEIVERPRKFVRADAYFGPDRRRKRAAYSGPDRRDFKPVEVGFIDIDFVDK